MTYKVKMTDKTSALKISNSSPLCRRLNREFEEPSSWKCLHLEDA